MQSHLFHTLQALLSATTPRSATTVLLEWIETRRVPAAALLPEGRIISTQPVPGADFHAGLQALEEMLVRERLAVDSPPFDDDALFILPLVYGGAVRGLVAVADSMRDDPDLMSLHAALASRLDMLHAERLQATFTNELSTVYAASSAHDAMNRACTVAASLLADAATVIGYDPNRSKALVLASSDHQLDVSSLDLPPVRQLLHLAADDPRIPINYQRALQRMGYQQVLALPLSGTPGGASLLLFFYHAPLSRFRITPPHLHTGELLASALAGMLTHLAPAEGAFDRLDDRLFRQLVDRANVAIDIIAPDGRQVYRNAAWETRFGYPMEAVPPLVDRLPPELQQRLDLILQAAERGWQGYVTLDRHQGGNFEAHLAVMALRDSRNRIAGYCLIADDVTELSDRMRDLAAMTEISLLVQTTFDLEKLNQQLYDALMRVQSPDLFGLAVFDPVQDRLHVSSMSENKDCTPPSEALLNMIVHEARPVLWLRPDERDPALPPDPRPPDSFIGLPLIARERVLGTIFSQAHHADAFDEHDLQFMLTLANSAAMALENMQLLDDTRRQMQEISIINDLSQTLARSLGREDTWQKLHDALAELFPDVAVGLMIYDSQNDRLSPPPLIRPVMVEAPEELSRAVISSGIPLRFDDLQHEDERLRSLSIRPDNYRHEELRAWLGAPLMNRQRQVTGVVCLLSTMPYAFDDEAVSLLDTLTAQVSLALDNARLLASEQTRRQVADSLIEMARAVSATLNADAVIERFLGQTTRITHFDRAAVFMLEDQDYLRVRAVLGFQPGLAGQRIAIEADSPLAQIIDTRLPSWIGDVEDAPQWASQTELLCNGEPRSWLAVPLVVQSDVVGILSLDSERPYAFDDTHAHTIFALARQAAIALENARLHSEAERNLTTMDRRARRLSFLHRIATAVSASLEPNEIMGGALDVLVTGYQADYGAIFLIDENRYYSLAHEYPVRAMHMDPDELAQVLHGLRPVFFQAGEAFVAEDEPPSPFGTELEHPAGDLRGLLGMGVLMLAPLLANDQFLGVVALGSSDSGRVFTPGDRDSFVTAAAQIAMAIHNAELYAQAVQTSRLKSEFLATVSHELRTPLNTIIGYSEMLLGGTYGALNEKQNERLNRVFNSGHHLLHLINSILDLSRIEAGRLELNPQHVDLEPLLVETVHTVAADAERKGLRLHLDIAPRLPEFEADPLRLQQILVNLLGNAIKFTQEGSVSLQARGLIFSGGQSDDGLRPAPDLHISDGTWLHLAVHDTGIGIRPQDHSTIFEVFRQADGSDIRSYQGSGLGLAITQRLVQLHGGQIWVESEMGTGSSFHVLLPGSGFRRSKRRKRPVEAQG